MNEPWPPPYTYGRVAISSAAAITRATTPSAPELLVEPAELPPALELLLGSAARGGCSSRSSLKPSALHVAGATTPSTCRSCSPCRRRNDGSGSGPNSPSTGTCSASCSSRIVPLLLSPRPAVV